MPKENYILRIFFPIKKEKFVIIIHLIILSFKIYIFKYYKFNRRLEGNSGKLSNIVSLKYLREGSGKV